MRRTGPKRTSRADGRCGRLAGPGWRPGGAGRPGNDRLEEDRLGESCEEDAVRCAAAGALEPGSELSPQVGIRLCRVRGVG